MPRIGEWDESSDNSRHSSIGVIRVFSETERCCKGIMNRSLQGYGLVVVAATLWATIGIFYKALIDEYGLTPLAAAAFRGAVGGLILLTALLLLRVDLHVHRRDWPIFLAYGVFGVALFFIVYVNAINLTGVAMAAVLMYTAPAWVAAISWRWLGEHLGRNGLLALGLALCGAALVARVYDPALLMVNSLGILAGLAAGLTYGLYSVFNKVLVRRYRPWVVQVYGLLIGAFILVGITPKADLGRGFTSWVTLVLLLGLGLIPTLLASLAYAVGVQWVPVSTASILATLELAVATLLGYVFFGERLAPLQWIGAALILAAVLLLRPGARSKHELPDERQRSNRNQPELE
jgi:DME family drug/metabolite transporter